jgi:hypothetical protein
MVNREAHSKDGASDYPKLTIGTRSVCQARAGWTYAKRDVAGAQLLVGLHVSDGPQAQRDLGVDLSCQNSTCFH